MARKSHKQPSDRDSTPGSSATEVGVEIASNMVGVGVSIAAGPLGAFAGPTATTFVRLGFMRLMHEIQRRRLSPREEQRVATALTVAAERIQARLDQGDQPRNDGFFDPGPFDRSAAEEVAEAVIRSARDDPQEKKLPYYGRLLANLAFDETIDPAAAYMLIRKADALTYRQLCLLAVGAQQADTAPVAMVPSLNNKTIAVQSLVEEMAALRDQGFIQQDGFLIGRQQWSMGQPSPLAETMYRLMGLDALDEQDVATIAAQLRALQA
jgi:hypothetical protein